MTITENLRYFATVLRTPRSDIAHLIDEVGLTDAAHTLVGELSGGQRTALAAP